MDYSIITYGGVALAVVGLILLVFRPKNTISFFPLVFRIAALLFLLMAAAGPYSEDEHRASRALVLLDVSDSNDPGVTDTLISRVNEFKSKDLDLNVVAFADKVSPAADANLTSFHAAQQNWSNLNIGTTNFEMGLNGLSSLEPASVVLISDGYETKGNADAKLKEIRERGFRIFPMVPKESEATLRTFRISKLYVPLVAPSEKSVDIRVSVMNSSKSQESGILEVKHDGKVVLSQRVSVPSDREIVVVAKSDPSKEGIKEITATLKPDDGKFAPSSETSFLSGEARERVLLVSGTSDDARFLKRLLEGQAFEVKELVGQDEAQRIGEFSQYSVVVFNNIPLPDLPRGIASNVESYVQDGGSFVMIGGNRSFGLGGYINSSIEDVLPVTMLPPQTVEKRLNLAVQLVIDKSGSMAENNKLEYAKEAAVGVVENLKDEDYIGVMGFDTNPFVVIRLKRVSDTRDEANKRINLLNPHGGTSLVGALDEARRDLVRVNAGRKHVFVLSDGEITDAPAHYYYEMVKQLRLAGVTVSTVMLGSDADQRMLKEMANLGGGSFYQTSDARSLPKIFIADLKVASGERTMKEETDYSVRVGPGDLRTTKIESYPHLRGYVQTKIKSRANLELLVAGETKSEPLLASWSYGKGKSVAFTSDANGRWSNDWVNWPQFHRFWSDVIESLRVEKNEAEDKIKFDLRSYYEKGLLHLDLSVFSENAPTGVEGELILPNGEKRRSEFTSLAAGHYHMTVDNALAGKYEFRGQVGRTKLTPVAFSLSGELFGEKKGQGFNLPFLRNLASATFGKINPSLEDLKSQSYVSKTKQELTHFFMAIALFMLLLEIIWREVFTGRKFFKLVRT